MEDEEKEEICGVESEECESIFAMIIKRRMQSDKKDDMIQKRKKRERERRRKGGVGKYSGHG